MRPNIHLHWGAMLGAIALAFVFGGIWYGPLFGRTWARLAGFPADYKPKPHQIQLAMALQLVGTFLIVFCLTHDMQVWDPRTWGQPADAGSRFLFGLAGGFFTWLGFFVPKELARKGWEGKPWSLILINMGHDFISLQLIAQVLSHWG
jgi:hypothetical protein